MQRNFFRESRQSRDLTKVSPQGKIHVPFTRVQYTGQGNPPVPFPILLGSRLCHLTAGTSAECMHLSKVSHCRQYGEAPFLVSAKPRVPRRTTIKCRRSRVPKWPGVCPSTVYKR